MIQFSEKLESNKILQLLAKALPYYLRSWHDIDDTTGLFGSIDPTTFNMRMVGSSSPVIEYVIRPHLQIVCALASYLYGPNKTAAVEGVDREKLTQLVRKGLRWACETHLTGSRDVETFLERKRWGQNWRSGLWASLTAICAYFADSVLDEDLKRRVRTVVEFEANRFIGVMPPDGCEGDTKLEENAQDTLVMAWALNMMPDHPNAARWEESLTLWSLNIATTIFDAADHSAHKGHSVAQWISTQTLFPDSTAENHGFFNPEILSYGTWIVLAAAAYTLHDRQPPDSLFRKNHQATYDVLLRYCLPNGIVYAPGGSDLPFFFPRPFGLAWGLWNNDAGALRMTTRLLALMDSVLSEGHSDQVPWIHGFAAHHEGWELLFQSQPGFELAMLALLPFPTEHRFFSLGQIESAVDTRKIYRFVEVCYRRNTRACRSVAWKALGQHPIIGLSMHSHPNLIANGRAAVLGMPRVDNEIRFNEVLFHNDRFQKDGFDTLGRIHYYGASRELILTRDVRVLTWGDDGMVVLDKIVAEKDVYFNEQYLSPVYLVNDLWTDSQLSLTSGSLSETVIAGEGSGRVITCPAFWASIETHLVFQFLWGRDRGLCYLPATSKNAPRYWKNCQLDTLAVHVEGKAIRQGETAYEVGFYVGGGKGPRPFKSAGIGGEFFKGLVIMDGKNTIGLD